MNSVYSSDLKLFNPYNQELIINEIYSSDDDLHLEILNDNKWVLNRENSFK